MDNEERAWNDSGDDDVGPTSRLWDEWGPSHVLQVYNPKDGLHGILVIDNTTLGPGLGGISISPSLSGRNVIERARSMTWTCALMDAGFGGAAAWIRGKPTVGAKNQLIRAFAKKVGFYVPWLFVATPDRDVGKKEMGVFAEEVGDWQGATGKPEYMQGIPHELGLVSFGIGVAIENCLRATDSWMSSPGGLKDARVAMLGHHSTGMALAKYLARKGAHVVAICDETSTLHDPKGIDVERIPRTQSSSDTKHLIGKVGDVEVLPPNDITRVECDVFVFTDDHQILRTGMVRRVRARCVVEGAHGLLAPITYNHFHRDGVLVVPDLLAMAGGVIGSCAEFQQMPTERAFSMIEAKVGEVTRRLIADAHQLDAPMRELVEDAAKQRIIAAMGGVV